LLRFFHIKDISPSGRIAIPKKRAFERKAELKTVNCDIEIVTDMSSVVPLNDMETRVPYKIMSFDIEASSSHGDFPVPVKTYKKLATNIIEYFENLKTDITKEKCASILNRIILTAFGYDTMEQIDLVYPKNPPNTKKDVENVIKLIYESLLKIEDNHNEGKYRSN
jgi:hypothetical protein